VILKEKGANFTLPVNPPAGKALRSDVDNLVWMNGIDALTEGGGSPLVRAGVLRLLSTISGLTVVKSTTDGQSTLTLTAGPEVFGGAGKNVVVINAKTGLPISSWTGDLPPSVHGQPTPASMTTYQVSRVTVANIEAGKFCPAPGARRPVPGARCPAPGARRPVPGARSPAPAARRPRPGAQPCAPSSRWRRARPSRPLQRPRLAPAPQQPSA